MVEYHTLLTVVNVNVIRDNVLTQNKTVFKALNCNASYNVMVVLVARHHKTYGMAGIFLQFLFEQGVTNGFIETELTVADPYAGNVLKVCSALRGLHFVLVQMNSELKICH